MSAFARFLFGDANHDWRRGHWSGVLIGTGYGSWMAGLLLMSNRWEVHPAELTVVGSLLFVAGIVVRERTRKASGGASDGAG